MRKIVAICFTAAVLVAGTGMANAYFADSVYVPDIETFMQIGVNGGAHVSKDGSIRCFSSSMSGVSQAYRMEEGWPAQFTFFTDGIDAYSLSHDGKWAIVEAATGGSEQTNLHLVEVATGRTEPLTDLADVQISGVFWSPDDTRIYYRSNQVNGTDFYAYEMNLATREAKQVFAQEGYNGPYLISPDGQTLITYRYNSNVDNDLYLVDLASGSSENLTEHDGTSLYEAAGFSADGSMLYIATNANDDGIARRATLDLKSKEIKYLEDDTVWEVEAMVVSDDATTMMWIVNEEGYGRLKLYNLAAEAELPSPPLDGLIENPVFDGTSAVLFDYTSPGNPPDCWRWDYNTQKLERWTNVVNAGIDRSIFVEPELIKYPSFDGMEISAFLYLPKGTQKGDKIPFIVYAHGGPESQFRPYFIRNFQYFVLNGFGVIAVNPRGSSGYGKEFQDMDNYKNRLKSVQDYEFATKWLIEQEYAHPDKIGVTGGSYGGYMTLACLTENPELYAAGIDNVGIANFYTFLMNTKPYRRALRESEYGPLTDSAFLVEISPLTHVDKIKAPLLVIHGENDPRVPVGEARQIAAAISARGGIVDTLIFADEGHGVRKRANVLITYRKMVDFFKEHLQ